LKNEEDFIGKTALLQETGTGPVIDIQAAGQKREINWTCPRFLPHNR
jgi:hypothetical protein